MGVQPDQLQLVGGEHPLDRPRRQPVLEPEAELGVELAGLHVAVGRGLDPRRDPDQHPLRRVEQPLAALDLVEGVEDQVADAGAGGEEDLLVGLVVAVHVDAVGVEAGAQGHVQLAAGGDVDREPLLGEEPVGGGAGERLAGEEDLEVGAAALEGLAVGAGAGADVVLGVEVGRRAELRRQLDHVAAGHLEVAALVDAAAGRVDRRARDRIAAHDRPRLFSLRHRTGILTVLTAPERTGRRALTPRLGVAGVLRTRATEDAPCALSAFAAEQAADRADGFVDDFADRRFRPGDAVDDAFGDAGDAGAAEGPAERAFVDAGDRVVDGFGDLARWRRGGARAGSAAVAAGAAATGRRNPSRSWRCRCRLRCLAPRSLGSGASRGQRSRPDRRRHPPRGRRFRCRAHRHRSWRDRRRLATEPGSAPDRALARPRRSWPGGAFGVGAEPPQHRRRPIWPPTSCPFETAAASSPPPPPSAAIGQSRKTWAETSTAKTTMATAIKVAPPTAPTR